MKYTIIALIAFTFAGCSNKVNFEAFATEQGVIVMPERTTFVTAYAYDIEMSVNRESIKAFDKVSERNPAIYRMKNKKYPLHVRITRTNQFDEVETSELIIEK